MGKTKRGLLVLASAACVFLVTSCVNHEEKKTSYKLTVTTDEGVEKVTIKSGDNEVSDLNSIEEGTKLTAVINLKDDFETSAVTLDGAEVAVTDGTYAFTMPSKDATLDVKTESTLPPDIDEPVVTEFKLTITKDEHISSVKVFDGETEITDLTKIEKGKVLTVKVEAQEDFAVDTVKFNDQVVTLESDGIYKITMADKDSALDITSRALKEYEVVCSVDSHIDDVTLKVDGKDVSGKILEGSVVTVEVTCKAHYVVDEILMNGEELNAQDDVYTFVMPQENVELDVSSKYGNIDTKIDVDNDAEKGDVTVEVAGKKDYVSGTPISVEYNSEVIVKVVPKTGFVVKSLTVDGEEVAFNTTYSFRVTKEEYSIKVNYAQMFVANARILMDSQGRMNQFTEIGLRNSAGEKIENGSMVLEGETIFVDVVKNYRWSVGNEEASAYLHVNDKVYSGTDTEVATISEEDPCVMTFKVTMPSAEANISFAYTTSPASDEDPIAGTLTFKENEFIKVYGYDSTKKYSRGSVVLERLNEGYIVESIKYTYENSEEVVDTNTYNLPNFGSGNIAFLNLAKSNPGNVTIEIIGSVHETAGISYKNADAVVSNNGSLPEKAIVGSKVTIRGIKPKDESKFISKINVEGPTDGNAYQATYGDLSWTIEFTMPEASTPVTISFELSNYSKVSFKVNDNIASYGFSASSNTITNYDNYYAKPNSTFYFFVSPKEGNLISKVTGSDGNALSYYSTNTARDENGEYINYSIYTGTVPSEGDLTIKVETSEAYFVTSADSEDGTISGLNASGYAKGATVNFYINLKSQTKEVSEVILKNGSEVIDKDSVSFKESGSSYSFVMPEHDVEISFDTQDIPKTTINVEIVNDSGKNLSELISNIRINDDRYVLSKSYSGAQLDSGDLKTIEPLVGSQLNLSAYMMNKTYKIGVSYVKDDETKELGLMYSSGTTYNFASLPVDGVTKVIFTISENEPLTATIDNQTGLENLDVTYRVNGSEVKTLEGNVYNGDSLQIQINSEAPEGKGYVATITNTETGAEISGYNGSYTINSNFTITFKIIDQYKVTVDNRCSSYTYVRWSLNGVYQTSTFETITETNAKLSVSVMNYSESFNYELSIAGEVVEEGTAEFNTMQYQATFNSTEHVVTGNVVLTITPVK